MTTARVLAVLTEQQVVAKIEAAGYRREPCKACDGSGHFTIVADNAHNWKKYLCETCAGAGQVWREPLNHP